MKRLFQILTLLALIVALPACRDAGGPDNPAPTPTPTPVPTPTPAADSTTDSSGDTSTTDGGVPSAVPNSGAAMVSSQESIIVTAVAPVDATVSEITVQRPNGEIWTFDVFGAPMPAIGNEALFESANLVFGDTSGFLLFPFVDGGRHRIADVTRIQ